MSYSIGVYEYECLCNILFITFLGLLFFVLVIWFIDVGRELALIIKYIQCILFWFNKEGIIVWQETNKKVTSFDVFKTCMGKQILQSAKLGWKQLDQISKKEKEKIFEC